MTTLYAPLPVSSLPVRFSVVLGGHEYTIETKYRDADEAGWIMDIDRTDTGAVVAHGIPLVRGADLMEQYAYTNFVGRLVLYGPPDSGDSPTADELGKTFKLVYEVDV